MNSAVKQTSLRCMLSLLILIGWSERCAATTIAVPGDADMVMGARAIIKAKVVAIGSGGEQGGDIFTYVRLNVEQVFKGKISAGEIVIKQPGGELKDEATIFFGAPRFAPGESVLLYLDTWPDGSLRVHQMLLGKLSITSDSATGRSLIARDDAGEGVELVSAAREGMLAGLTTRMELSRYMERLMSTLAATRETGELFEARLYEGAPLLVRPPEYDIKMRRGEIEPRFALPVQAGRWFETDRGQPVVFYVNPNGAPYPHITEDLNAAMNVWSALPGVRMRFVNGGATAQCLPTPGINTITFDNCDRYWTASTSCSGIVSLTSNRYNTATPSLINGRLFYQIIQSHISFNPYSGCYLGVERNFQEVAVHELGHALGLHHSWEPSISAAPTPAEMDATMYPVMHFDGRAASLRLDDLNGAAFIYGLAGSLDNPAIVTGTPLALSALNAPYLQALSVAGGIPPYTWGVAGGSGLPPGISLTAKGELAGNPTVTGTYDFTIQATDAIHRVTSKSLSIRVIEAPYLVRAEYNSKKEKLTVTGGGFDPSSKLFVNRKEVRARSGQSGQLTAKKLSLPDGIYELRVIGPTGVQSNMLLLIL